MAAPANAAGAAGAAHPPAAAAGDDEALYAGAKQALAEGEYGAAVEALTRVLEARVGRHGELAVEVAPCYFLYGRALFLKAREEQDVFGDPVRQAAEQKALQQQAAQEAAAALVCKGKAKVADAGPAQPAAAAEAEEEEEEEGLESEEEEEENDMELAWRMIELARVLFERAGGRTREVAEAYLALGELSYEREDFDTGLADFQAAIRLLEAAAPREERLLASAYLNACTALHSKSLTLQGEAEKAAACHEAKGFCEQAMRALEACKAQPGADEAERRGLDEMLGELQAKRDELRDAVDGGAQTVQQLAQTAGLSTTQIGFDAPVLAPAPAAAPAAAVQTVVAKPAPAAKPEGRKQTKVDDLIQAEEANRPLKKLKVAPQPL